MGIDRFRINIGADTATAHTLTGVKSVTINGNEFPVVGGPDAYGNVSLAIDGKVREVEAFAEDGRDPNSDNPPPNMAREWVSVNEVYGPLWVFIEKLGWKRIQMVRPTKERIDSKVTAGYRLIFKNPQRIHKKNPATEITLAADTEVLVVRG